MVAVAVHIHMEVGKIIKVVWPFLVPRKRPVLGHTRRQSVMSVGSREAGCRLAERKQPTNSKGFRMRTCVCVRVCARKREMGTGSSGICESCLWMRFCGKGVTHNGAKVINDVDQDEDNSVDRVVKVVVHGVGGLQLLAAPLVPALEHRQSSPVYKYDGTYSPLSLGQMGTSSRES